MRKMAKLFIGLIFLFSILHTNGQEKNSLTGLQRKHKYILHTTGLYNINRNSGRELTFYERALNSGVKSAMRVKNTLGYQAGITYEFRNRNGFTFSPGILFGMQNIYLINYFTYHHVDPNLYMGEKGHTDTFKKSNSYIGWSFLLGHDFMPFNNKKFTLQAKAGVGTLFFPKTLSAFKRHYIFYEQKNDTFQGVNFATTDIGSYASPIGNPYYEFYIGGVYTVEKARIKECRLGIRFMHAFGLFTGEGDDYINIYTNRFFDKDGEHKGGEIYYDRFRNVALTIGVGI